jgi:hypothetical protein
MIKAMKVAGFVSTASALTAIGSGTAMVDAALPPAGQGSKRVK